MYDVHDTGFCQATLSTPLNSILISWGEGKIYKSGLLYVVKDAENNNKFIILQEREVNCNN